MAKETRSRVYEAIDGERAYQDEKWGPRTDESIAQTETPAHFVLYMRQYLGKVEQALTDLTEPQATAAAMEMMRKVTALGVACMEIHGAPLREGY